MRIVVTKAGAVPMMTTTVALGGRGHGGWSGDPEGHSEASRRGWENRR